MRNQKIKKGVIAIFVSLLFINANIIQAVNTGWNTGDTFTWNYKKHTSVSCLYDAFNSGSSTVDVERESSVKIASIDETALVYTYDYESTEEYQRDDEELSITTDSGNYESSYSRQSFFNKFSSLNDLLEISISPKNEQPKIKYFKSLSNAEQIISSCFLLKTNWELFNSDFKAYFEDSVFVNKLAIYTNYEIMGKNNIEEAIDEIKSNTRHWTISLEARLYSITEYIYFELKFSKTGVLEKLVFENNYLSTETGYVNSKHLEIFTLRNSGVALAIVIPTILLIFIGFLVYRVKTSKKKQPNQTESNNNQSDSLSYRIGSSSVFNIDLIAYSGELIQDNCSICKLQLREDQKLSHCPYCNSLFHEEHMEEWMKYNQDCPVCNQIIINYFVNKLH